LQKAADSGDPVGETRLGMMYLAGRGVARDDRNGAQWVRRAADQKFAEALLLLSRLYAEGRGVAKDPMRALNYRSQLPEKDRPSEDGLQVMLTAPVQVFRMQFQHGGVTAHLLSSTEVASIYPNLQRGTQ
jgi:TPR repeat protein